MRRPIDVYTAITSVHGQPTGMGMYGRHLGYDYAGPEGRIIRAPISGVIVKSYLSASIGNVYEIREDVNGRLHRICHMKTRPLGVGARVSEGADIARTGGAKGTPYSGTLTTGPHCHHDVRKAGTTWDSAFSNYVDWEKLIAAPVPGAGMPPIGSGIQLLPVQTRTTFRSGTTSVAGTLSVVNNNFTYIVRGYDPVYNNRVLINSASGGGSGVALALYYTNGTRIAGWKQL